MLYADRFSGHLEGPDPRSVVTGAHGCIWPTMHAYRYLLTSTDAYGILFGLRAEGVLFELITAIGVHNQPIWNMISGPFPFVTGQIQKVPLGEDTGYRLDIGLSAGVCGTLLIQITRPVEKCNRDYDVGDYECPSYSGGTGDTCQLQQVEWNETEPP